MKIAELAPLILQISLALVVFGVGLRARTEDLTYVLRRPGLLARSLLAMNVVMPIVAVAIAKICDLRVELEAALMLLAVSPVPPILPRKEIKAGGHASYAIGLLACSTVLAIVFVPASVAVLGRAFGRTLYVPFQTVAATVAVSVLLPLVAGALLGRAIPRGAPRVAKVASVLGGVLLVAVFLLMLVASRRALFGQLGQYTLVAIVLFALASVAVGHFFGGPDHDHRTVLALSTASRHPGVALAVAHTIFPNVPELTAAILLCFLVSSLATIPYAKRRKRSQTPPKHTEAVGVKGGLKAQEGRA